MKFSAGGTPSRSFPSRSREVQVASLLGHDKNSRFLSRPGRNKRSIIASLLEFEENTHSLVEIFLPRPLVSKCSKVES